MTPDWWRVRSYCSGHAGPSNMDRGAHRRHTPLVTPALFLDNEAVLKSHCGAVEVIFQWRPQFSGPSDGMVLEAAVNGRADALITHDVRDFARGLARSGLQVLRSGELLT